MYAHRCFGAFGVDTVDADAETVPFLCDGLYEVDNGCFGRRINAVESSSPCIGTGGEEDQLALAFFQVREGFQSHIHGSHVIGLYGPGNGFVVSRDQRFFVENACCIDYEVNPFFLFKDAAQGFGHFLTVSYIHPVEAA